VVVTAIIAGLLALVYRFICVWQNKSRDDAGTLEGFDHAFEDDLTDMKVWNPNCCSPTRFLSLVRPAVVCIDCG
jgi:hypothetical protein